MTERRDQRRFRIVITDEESGEEVASADGVETLIVLATPDTELGEDYRRILVGDVEMSVQLIFDIVQAVTERVTGGTLMDLDELLDDRMLLDMTQELPRH